MGLTILVTKVHIEASFRFVLEQTRISRLYKWVAQQWNAMQSNQCTEWGILSIVRLGQTD